MVLRLLKQDDVVDPSLDPEELEEIVERAVTRAVKGASDAMQTAQRVLQVYQFIEKSVGDKQVAVELTRIVFTVHGGGDYEH